MRMPHHFASLVIGLIGFALDTPPTLARPGDILTKKPKQVRNMKNYDQCRLSALKTLKSGSISKERFSSQLDACNERFPAASLYAKCKKEKLKEIREADEKDPSNSCHKLVENVEYRPSDMLPFTLQDDQLFFAGIGLNKPQTTTALNPPNFNCKQLQDGARNQAGLKHVLFGNHPRFFAGLSALSGADLRRLFPVDSPSVKGVDLDGYGRVYGDPGKPSATVFFPSGNCTFEGSIGPKIAGLGAHYLIDTAGSVAMPYFGIIYYRDHVDGPTTTEIVNQLVRILGPEFKEIPKSNDVKFIASNDFTEKDEEKDPKNLCKAPRSHTYIGLVQSIPGKPQKPFFALVANVKNLCEFGDRLTGPRVH